LSNPDEGWLPWLKDELGKRGYAVFVPAMPNPEHLESVTHYPMGQWSPNSSYGTLPNEGTVDCVA
jgi:hypothetical protein